MICDNCLVDKYYCSEIDNATENKCEYFCDNDHLNKVMILFSLEHNIYPTIIYILELNEFNVLICNELNTDTYFYTTSDRLIQFDYDKFCELVELFNEWEELNNLEEINNKIGSEDNFNYIIKRRAEIEKIVKEIKNGD